MVEYRTQRTHARPHLRQAPAVGMQQREVVSGVEIFHGGRPRVQLGSAREILRQTAEAVSVRVCARVHVRARVCG